MLFWYLCLIRTAARPAHVHFHLFAPSEIKIYVSICIRLFDALFYVVLTAQKLVSTWGHLNDHWDLLFMLLDTSSTTSNSGVLTTPISVRLLK